MSYYPREVIDCYLDEKFEELLDVPDAESVYVASVAKDLQNDKFYIERGVHYGDYSSTRKVPLIHNEVLEKCINEYNENREDGDKLKVTAEGQSIKIEEELTGLFKLQSSKKVRPLVGGIEIGYKHYKSGTLGAIVLCEGTQSRKYILSNFHVMFSSERFIPNKLFFQPSLSSRPITRSINYCNIIARSSYGHFGKYVDVGLAEIINNTRSKKGTVSVEDEIKGWGVPEIGQNVMLHGASSGPQDGTVRSINTYVKFKSIWRGGKSHIFEKQILTDNMSKDGDSGSVLIRGNIDSNGTKEYKAVGLLIGGDDRTFSIYNNFEYIFNPKYNSKYPNMRNVKLKEFLKW